jgi:hypothetical protein
VALLLEIQSLAAICASRCDSTLQKGIIPTIARQEPYNGAQIRAKPVAMRRLRITSERQMPMHGKSQKVFDFMDETGLSRS